MVEFLIIAVLVTWSAVVVFKKVCPKTTAKILLALSLRCEQAGWSGLAKWLKPVAVMGCGGNCGCSTDADPAEPKKVQVQAVKWK